MTREAKILVDRARMAVKKWIPYSSVGAAISFVVGFVFGLPPAQVIVSATMTATLIFSGLLFHSYGREKEQAKVQQ
jgi:hypothetical protein